MTSNGNKDKYFLKELEKMGQEYMVEEDDP